MIGILDSRLGGMTVARELSARLPGYEMVYMGDTARMHSGHGSPDAIVAGAVASTRFLLEQGATMVVVACHAIAAVAFDTLDREFDIPLIDVVTPAAHRAATLSKRRLIGVIGDRMTVDSGIYESKILGRWPDARVFARACPLLTPLIEEGWSGKPETTRIVKKYLHPLKTRQVDTLVLGSSHYPELFAVLQRKMGRGVQLVDPSCCVASATADYLAAHPHVEERLSRRHRFRFFLSDVSECYAGIARRLLRRNVTLLPVSQ